MCQWRAVVVLVLLALSTRHNHMQQVEKHNILGQGLWSVQQMSLDNMYREVCKVVRNKMGHH